MLGLLGQSQKHRSRAPEKFRLAPVVEELEQRQVPTVLSVAAQIVNSQEHFINFVTSEYLTLLHRAPDPAGLGNLVSAMDRGLSPEAVEAIFTSSTEYIIDHGDTVAGWLTGMYNDLLSRNPDAGGFQFWMNAMAMGASPFSVSFAISRSMEREALVITQDYQDFLGRAPDTGGLSFWLSNIQQGGNRESVAIGILSSQEYIADHNFDPNTIVIGFFQNVLGRQPSTTELSFFASQI